MLLCKSETSPVVLRAPMAESFTSPCLHKSLINSEPVYPVAPMIPTLIMNTPPTNEIIIQRVVYLCNTFSLKGLELYDTNVNRFNFT